nr:hypothetical protein [Tanacetum cinerariifolium]
APPMVQIADADDVPIPPVIQFGSNFHIEESSAMRDLLPGNNEFYAPGLMYYDLKSVHRGVMKLSKKMHDRAEELSRWEAWLRGRIPNNLRFQEEPSIYTAPVPRTDDPYVMVRDAAMDTQGDEDDPDEDEEEDPEEEPEEEEIEDENMVNDEDDEGNEEDDAEIADADDVPIPPVIQFGSNFHIGESSAMRDLLPGNNEFYAPGLMYCDLKSVHRGVMKLSKKMHDRYRTEKKMARKLRQDELRMNGQKFDITALDLVVRKNRGVMGVVGVVNGIRVGDKGEEVREEDLEGEVEVDLG